MNTEYYNFLRSKINIAPESGFVVDKRELSPILKPHQQDAVIWAIHRGRRALFEAFGLGKTIQQLEICRIITAKKGGKALIVCPLGVKQEFTEDARNLLGMDIRYVKTQEEAESAEETILVTNYERVRDGNIDPKYFKVTSLDEASVLRSFGSKTYQTFLDKFKGVEYKFVCTATPSPNKYKELIHYAGYLEIMDTGLALTRFFQRDSTKANNLTLYPHKDQEFWLWMSSWALFVTSPADLGYDPHFQSAGASVDKPCFTLIAKMDKRPPYLVATESGQMAIKVYETDSPMTRKIKEFMALYEIVDIKMRMLKIPELKKIMGFPENYVLVGMQADQKKFIGNAVEVNMARGLCEALCAKLIELNIKPLRIAT